VTGIDVAGSRARARRLAALTAACFAALLVVWVGSASAAYTASVVNQTLQVTGNGANDKLALRLNPSDTTVLQVDVGENGTPDFSFPLSSFTAIHVQAGAGNDEVVVDESSGSFTDKAITLDGGDGNDTLKGGSGNDVLVGGIGNDTIFGGRGSDVALMGDGADTFVWNPGDGSDTVEGQVGVSDVLQINGSNVSEKIDLSANGSRVRLSRDVANVTMDLNGMEKVNVAALGGTDSVTVHDLTGTDTKTANVALGASGGSGTGDGAADTVIAQGTPSNDTATLLRAAGGVSVSGLYTRVNVSGSEASDTVQVQGLAGTDKLISTIGVTGPVMTAFDGGDGSDIANYTGSPGADTISLVPDATATGVVTDASGAALLDTTAVESLVINGGLGNDTISGSSGLASLTHLTVNGGDGNDTLFGGDGGDSFNAGSGDDTVIGKQGNDVALLGGGNDTFVWNPGDASDIVEGNIGTDLLQFNGSNVNEKIDFSRNGGRVRLTRDVANVIMDVHGMDRARVAALGGADSVTVDDLSGTEMRSVAVDLGAQGGGGDGQADTVTLNGTANADYLSVTSAGADVFTFGLFAPVQISGSEPADDTLAINTLGGVDSVAVDSGVTQLIKPVVNLGPQ
jgi:Ca2+-binding RTX toxin-like protein